jgi:hypothetical protein
MSLRRWGPVEGSGDRQLWVISEIVLCVIGGGSAAAAAPAANVASTVKVRAIATRANLIPTSQIAPHRDKD